MTHRTFQFRLHSDHGNPEMTTLPPVVERLSDTGVWELQEPGLNTPPFRLYLLSLLLCMRYHLVSEASERQIPLQHLQATMTVEVSDAWDFEGFSAEFQLLLDPAASPAIGNRADAAALLAMRERMENSPVVRNLPAITKRHIKVERQN